MFKINRKLEYALIALKHLHAASKDKLVSAKEICDVYHTPFDPTSRVLQIMAQKGILKAEQGAHGGYHLVRDLGEVSLQDLTDIIIGPIEIANCFHGDYSHCELTACCNVIGPMLNLNSKLRDLFVTLKVKDLLVSTHNLEKSIKSKPIEKVSSR